MSKKRTLIAAVHGRAKVARINRRWVTALQHGDYLSADVVARLEVAENWRDLEPVARQVLDRIDYDTEQIYAIIAPIGIASQAQWLVQQRLF